MTDTLEKIVAEMRRWGPSGLIGTVELNEWADRLAALSGSAGEAVAWEVKEHGDGRVQFSIEQQTFTIQYYPDEDEPRDQRRAWYARQLHAALSKLAASPARADLGWRPIDSVPEDTDVIVWHRGRVALGRRFTRDDGVIWTVNGTSQHEAIWNALKFDPPKLWQPMLEAPDVQ